MTAKELMIGDWVECVDSTHKKKVYAQIDAIEEGQTCILVRLDNCNWFLDISFIKPIPLTCETLEKNGFEVTRNMSSSGNKDVWSLRVSKNKVFHIIEHHNKRKFPYFWIELGSNSDIKYVHQLQHALKLCEIEKEIVL